MSSASACSASFALTWVSPAQTALMPICAQRVGRVQRPLHRPRDGFAVIRDHAQLAGVTTEGRHGRRRGAGVRELVGTPDAVRGVDVVLQVLQPVQLVAHRLPASRPAPRASDAS